ncbi:hypothetical protein [Parvularcula dongshanensis]|uniref:Uncharacterized protein n=1 Tax=Parvularcula dongshanensis TaxID=1173995 RepID=A0A840I2C4_9PROT|nr:hypothetical protein [Parvularcula dongshanensis]MBB4658384.1 hypothetical protein [Parvularcula dongshanensis]
MFLVVISFSLVADIVTTTVQRLTGYEIGARVWAMIYLLIITNALTALFMEGLLVQWPASSTAG